jgi:hypothetical protein
MPLALPAPRSAFLWKNHPDSGSWFAAASQGVRDQLINWSGSRNSRRLSFMRRHPEWLHRHRRAGVIGARGVPAACFPSGVTDVVSLLLGPTNFGRDKGLSAISKSPGMQLQFASGDIWIPLPRNRPGPMQSRCIASGNVVLPRVRKQARVEETSRGIVLARQRSINVAR